MRAKTQQTNRRGAPPFGAVLRRLGVALLLLLTGCPLNQQSLAPRDGGQAILPAEHFGGEWWEFYKRGLILADSGKSREAMADFREAIAQRDQDQWQAEIETGRALDYFPHRELGILHVARKEFDKAISELENSLASAPSAKAAHYLSMARAGKFARDLQDRRAPEIFFEGSTALETTNSCRKVVTGVATDDTFLASLTVDGTPVPLPLVEKRRVFKKEVALAEGLNEIRVVATDYSGKSTEKSLEIYCDRRGPLIEIDQLNIGADQTTISGIAIDDHAMGSLSINGRPWPMTGKAAGYNFNFTLPEGRITIVAADRAGNVTGARVRRDEFYLQEYAGEAQPETTGDPAVDTAPPVITVEGLGAEQETAADSILLTGQISDQSLLVYISVNGEQLLNQKGRRVFFSQTCALREGENTLQLIAADQFGNKASQTIKVTRTPKSVGTMDTRLRLALLPFAGSTSDPEESDPFLTELRNAFADQERFNLVEQEHVVAASRAFHLSPGAMPTPGDAAAVGQAVGAQAVLTGRIMPGPDGVEIVGQLLDADSGALLSRVDTYGPTLKGLPADLAARLAGDFPMAEGTLIDIRGREILVDLNTQHRIRPQTRLICYREGPPARHPVTGELLKSEVTIIGELLVTEVGKESSRTRILHQRDEFLRGDRVITR